MAGRSADFSEFTERCWQIKKRLECLCSRLKKKKGWVRIARQNKWGRGEWVPHVLQPLTASALVWLTPQPGNESHPTQDNEWTTIIFRLIKVVEWKFVGYMTDGSRHTRWKQLFREQRASVEAAARTQRRSGASRLRQAKRIELRSHRKNQQVCFQIKSSRRVWFINVFIDLI